MQAGANFLFSPALPPWVMLSLGYVCMTQSQPVPWSCHPAVPTCGEGSIAPLIVHVWLKLSQQQFAEQLTRPLARECDTNLVNFIHSPFFDGLYTFISEE
jgi:hypothetical protein